MQHGIPAHKFRTNMASLAATLLSYRLIKAWRCLAIQLVSCVFESCCSFSPACEGPWDKDENDIHASYYEQFLKNDDAATKEKDAKICLRENQ